MSSSSSALPSLSSIPSNESLSSLSQSATSDIDDCGPGDRRVELVPYFQKRFTVNANHGYRLRVEARNGCNMEEEIFRYYRYADPNTGLPVDEFTGVCSWVDMEELPKDEPRATDCPRAFRKSYFDVVVDTETIASDLWAVVKEEVDQLVVTMNRGNVLVAGNSYWAGGEPSV